MNILISIFLVSVQHFMLVFGSYHIYSLLFIPCLFSVSFCLQILQTFHKPIFLTVVLIVTLVDAILGFGHFSQ